MWESAGAALVKWQYEEKKEDRSKRYCWNRVGRNGLARMGERGKDERQVEQSHQFLSQGDWKAGRAVSERSHSICWDKPCRITDDLSRSRGHLSILTKLNSSAAHLHSLPPSRNSFPDSWESGHCLPIFPPLCPLLPSLLCCLVLHSGAFIFWSSSRLSPSLSFLLTQYSLVVHIYYQHFKNLYWLMIPKFESPAQPMEFQTYKSFTSTLVSLKQLLTPSFSRLQLNTFYGSGMISACPSISSTPQMEPPSISPT